MQQKARKLDAVHFSVKYGIRLLLGGLGEEGRQNETKMSAFPEGCSTVNLSFLVKAALPLF